MNKFFLVLLFYGNLFAQNIEIGNHKNQLKVYNYVLNNLEKLKKDNLQEILYVNLKFGKNHFLKKINYFTCNEKNIFEEVKTETKVSNELNQNVEKNFSFFSSYPFFSRSIGESS